MSAHSLQRIVLTGFMGSGKTTVGRLLAARLSWDFIDLDDEISRRTGLSVPEIFARHGEPHFRLEETAALAECLQKTRVVLALGGGAPEAEQNRRLIQGSDNTAVVYLEGPFEILRGRCVTQGSEPGAVARPVLVDAEAASRRFARRTPLYYGIATHIFSTLDRSPESLAGELCTTLGPNTF